MPTLRVTGQLDLCVVVVALDARTARFFDSAAASGEWTRQLDAIRSARAGWIAAAVRDTVPTDLELAHASFARVTEDYRARARGGPDAPKEVGYRDVVERERDLVVVAWVVLADREVPDARPETALRSVDVLDALERLKTLGRQGTLIHHRIVVAPSRGRLPESRIATLYPELATLTDPGDPTYCEGCACPYEGVQCPHCGLRNG